MSTSGIRRSFRFLATGFLMLTHTLLEHIGGVSIESESGRGQT
jgi:hypothetical protein